MYEYDDEVDILDIKFRDGISAKQIEAEAGTIIDLDNRGRLLDVEIIAPHDGWSVDAIKQHVSLTDDEKTYLEMVLETFLRNNVDTLQNVVESNTLSAGKILIEK